MCSRLFFTFIFLLSGLIWAPAAQAQATAREGFSSLNKCLAQDASRCRPLLTAGSHGLYERLISYRVLQCLPKNINYISQTRSGQHELIRGTAKLAGGMRALRLAFVKEKGSWKLDIPHSLQTALGEKWESHLNITEQIYLALQKRMGDKLNCTAIENLALGSAPKIGH